LISNVIRRERKSKVDDGILQLKVDIITANLLKCTDKLSDIQLKYNKEINELKPDLNQKEAQVKSKSQFLKTPLYTLRYLDLKKIKTKK